MTDAEVRLGAAVHTFTGGWSNTSFAESADIAVEQARAILAADPELAEALELGLAWKALEPALAVQPDGFGLYLTHYGDEEWVAQNVYGGYSHHSATGPTPTAALLSLATALEKSA